MTLLGLSIAVAGGGPDRPRLPGGRAPWSLGFGATLDVLDGILARLTRTETAHGAFLDSFTDRVGEVAMWTGLGFYLAEARGGDSGDAVADRGVRVAAHLPICGPRPRQRACRARAASWAGPSGSWSSAGGWASPGVGLPTLEATVWMLAVLTWVTVLQRFYNTWVQLEGVSGRFGYLRLSGPLGLCSACSPSR